MVLGCYAAYQTAVTIHVLFRDQIVGLVSTLKGSLREQLGAKFECIVIIMVLVTSNIEKKSY
jgi:hypothetical protein